MDTKNYCSIFEALGFEIRLKIFKYIVQAGNEGVAPKHIIKEFNVDSGTLNFHLKKLQNVKLIAKKEDGKRACYCVSSVIPKAFLQIFLIELANEGAAFMPLL
jgi:ArsR family transcriptional regulator, arsenate/arsenite/antimonite-responsive transcriptional repressor